MLEVFETQFKNSIDYGMTFNQFWFDDPQLYYIYQDHYYDKLKEDMKLRDIYNYQLGTYIWYAIGHFMTDKGKVTFPKEPIFMAKKEEKPQTTEDMRDKFLSMVEKVNNKFK